VNTAPLTPPSVLVTVSDVGIVAYYPRREIERCRDADAAVNVALHGILAGFVGATASDDLPPEDVEPSTLPVVREAQRG
jgi:hypothetical protein